ncbi:MAG: hypothetical protein HY820_11690 [Acidobacteria bacterium]|nr:hypothetical protein [Acidobacteriota bacterium]
MAKNHLLGFLEDLKAVNPDFRASTSSLKGLIQHLERTVTSPQPLTYSGAVGHCKQQGDARIAKYRPAIERMVSVWGHGGIRPYPAIRTGASLKHGGIKRLCFRGDDRPPDLIFAGGFTKRVADAKPKYRGYQMANTAFSTAADPVRDPIQGFSRAGDLDPDSAVCITPDFRVAALFPLPTTPERLQQSCFIYLVYVESGYNTNARQVLDALEGLSKLTQFEGTEAPGAIPKAQLHQVRIQDIQQNLYGRELATDSIPPSSICGAFRVTRTWATVKHARQWLEGAEIRVPTGADYKDGGSFRVVQWIPNPKAAYPSEAYKTAVEELAKEMAGPMANGDGFRLPVHTDGYAASTAT